MILTSVDQVPASALPRFFNRVRITDECWLWTGATAKGYGQFQLGNHWTVRAHRFAYVVKHGSINPDLTLDHLCKTRACVYWRHLEQVERGENARRGLALTTTCKSGQHPWVEPNIVRRPSRPGTGECRECAREAQRRRAK